MLETIRKHHYILMLLIAIVVCVAFVFFSDSSGPGRENPDAKPLFTLNGQDYFRNDISQIDSQRGMLYSLVDTSNQMAMFTDPLMFYVNTLGGNPRFGQPAIAQRYGMSRGDSLNFDFCMNVATLRNEAEKIGLEVGKEDLEKFVQTISGFQTNGQFDRTKYDNFLSAPAFGDKANAERRLYTALRDVMLFQRMNKLIGGTLAPSPAEVAAQYAGSNEKITAAYALVEKAKQTPPAPTEEAITKFYNDAKAAFEAHAADSLKPAPDPLILSEEKRSVRYVLVNLPKLPDPVPAPKPEDTATLPEDQKKAKEEEYKKKLDEHTAALATRAEAVKANEAEVKALKEKAANLSSDLVSDERANKSFEELAKKYGFEAKTSEPFPQAAPPADFKEEARLISEIFRAPNDPTYSQTVPTANGYALFEIAKIEAPAVLPLDQVKTKITEKLTADAVTEALKAAATTARTAILESIKSGKTFAEAASAAGLTPVEVPAFSQTKPTEAANKEVFTEAAKALNPGEVSEPKEVPEGLLLVSVLKRELPKAPTMEEDKKKLAKDLTQGGEGGFMPTYSPLFEAWFNAARNETSTIEQPGT